MRTVTTASKGELFPLYQQGLSANEASEKTRLPFKFVDDSFFEWTVSEIEEKKKQKKKQPVFIEMVVPPPRMLTSVVEHTDFALETTNIYVIEAYNRMIANTPNKPIQY